MRRPSLLRRNKPREILSLIRHEKRERMLKSKLQKYHAYDIKEAMLSMNEDERKRLYQFVDTPKLSSVFGHLKDEKAVDYLREIDNRDAAHVLENMEPDDAVDILQELKHDVAVSYLALIEEKRREHLRKLSKYKNLTAGSEMNPSYIAFSPEMDVKDAMKKLVQKAEAAEMIDTLFVVDEQHRLLGVVDLRELIVARHPKRIDEIMDKNFYAVHVEDSIGEVVRSIQKYDTLAMPVLNQEGTLEGIITMYDAMDIIEEASHDDLAKLAGLPTEDDVYESAGKSAKHRFPWLALLLVLNLIISSVLATFEETIAAITALVLFQPLIFAMAGNIGTQSLAVTILRISRETLDTRKNVLKHLGKETAIGAVNGLLLGGLSFATAWAFLTVSPMGIVGEGVVTALDIGMVVGLSVFISLLVSAFLASAIPVVLTALKVDPAVASGPFITTLNDITALVVYFGLATAMVFALL